MFMKENREGFCRFHGSHRPFFVFFLVFAAVAQADKKCALRRKPFIQHIRSGISNPAPASQSATDRM